MKERIIRAAPNDTACSPGAAWLMSAVLLAGCSGGEAPDVVPPGPMNLALAPGAIKELCFESKQGDVVIYRFEASAPLDFNLHYHRDGAVRFALSESSVAQGEGQYYVPEDRRYCLMWTNRGRAAVALSYRYRVYREEGRP